MPPYKDRTLNDIQSKLGTLAKKLVDEGKYDYLLGVFITEELAPACLQDFKGFDWNYKNLPKSCKTYNVLLSFGAYEVAKLRKGFGETEFDKVIFAHNLVQWLRDKITRRLYVRHHQTITMSLRCMGYTLNQKT